MLEFKKLCCSKEENSHVVWFLSLQTFFHQFQCTPSYNVFINSVKRGFNEWFTFPPLYFFCGEIIANSSISCCYIFISQFLFPPTFKCKKCYQNKQNKTVEGWRFSIFGTKTDDKNDIRFIAKLVKMLSMMVEIQVLIQVLLLNSMRN